MGGHLSHHTRQEESAPVAGVTQSRFTSGEWRALAQRYATLTGLDLPDSLCASTPDDKEEETLQTYFDAHPPQRTTEVQTYAVDACDKTVKLLSSMRHWQLPFSTRSLVHLTRPHGQSG